jgi:hypothetical protein
MSDTKTADISGISFTSSVFPTPADTALWDSLTPAQRLAIIERDEDEGFRSGVADKSSMQDILAGVLAEKQG